MASHLNYLLLLLVVSSALSIPQGRKYVVKSNSPKKVWNKQVEQVQGNELLANKAGDNQLDPMQQSPWSFLANSIKQLLKVFFSAPGDGLTPASDKMDGPQIGQGFSWGQVIGYGLKLLFVTLGGSSEEHDGIDKVGVEGPGVGGSPVQGIVKSLIGAMIGGASPEDGENVAKQTGELINLVIALMNALKASFSQRAIRARSMGEGTKFNDFTLAGIDMGKGFLNALNATSDSCRQQRICAAAAECVADVEARNAGLCHFASYATVNLMYYTQPASKSYKLYLDAARKGRTLNPDCKRMFLCNEI